MRLVSFSFNEKKGEETDWYTRRSDRARKRNGNASWWKLHRPNGSRLRYYDRGNDRRGDWRHQSLSFSGGACEICRVCSERMLVWQDTPAQKDEVGEQAAQLCFPSYGALADITKWQWKSKVIFQEKSVGGKVQVSGIGMFATTDGEHHLVYDEKQNSLQNCLTFSHSGSFSHERYGWVKYIFVLRTDSSFRQCENEISLSNVNVFTLMFRKIVLKARVTIACFLLGIRSTHVRRVCLSTTTRSDHWLCALTMKSASKWPEVVIGGLSSIYLRPSLHCGLCLRYFFRLDLKIRYPSSDRAYIKR